MLKTFYNLELGLPFEYSETTAIPELMYMRREHYKAEVPAGVLLITIGIDTQDKPYSVCQGRAQHQRLYCCGRAQNM